MEAALITGSRDWTDAERVRDVVQAYEFVVVGCARGADEHARQAAAAHGCMLKVFEADWNAHGRQAGMLRNLEMVLFCIGLRRDGILMHCHAFWDGQSRGTLHCASAATEHRIPVTWHR